MSEILTNKLTGTSTAGSIVVTGEGNSTTTNLQQGLAKAWVNFDGSASGATARDSFNVSSTDDDGTGTYGVNVNTSFSSANHASHGTCDAVGNFSAVEINTVATSGINSMRCWNDNPATIDATLVFVTMHGDLA